MTNPKTTYKWPIDDFSSVARRSYSNDLESPVFSLLDFKFYLHFHPTNRNPDSSKDYSSLYLYVYDFDNEEAVDLYVKAWLENNSGQRLSKREFQRSFNKQSNSWECERFVHHDDIYTNKNGFIKNDFLFVCCEVEYLVPKPEVLFKWPIKNVSNTINAELDTQLESKPFRIPSIKSTFHLLLRPVHETDAFKHYSSLCLCAKNLKTATIIFCKFWIENNEGTKMEQTAQMFLFGTPTDYICFPEFVHHNKLYPNNNFIKDDFVFICCELKALLTEKEQREMEVLKSKDLFERKAVTTSYYIVLFENDMFTIHKDDLGKLTTNLHSLPWIMDKGRSMVKFQNVNSSVVKAFVCFANHEVIENLDGIATDLLLFAHKYGFETLKIVCIDSLINTLNEQNSFERLVLALKHKNDKLKQKSVHLFARKNSTQDLINLPEWEALVKDDKHLADQLMDEFLKEKSRYSLNCPIL